MKPVKVIVVLLNRAKLTCVEHGESPTHYVFRICNTFTPQIVNHKATYLMFPLHQGIIIIKPGRVIHLLFDLNNVKAFVGAFILKDKTFICGL